MKRRYKIIIGIIIVLIIIRIILPYVVLYYCNEKLAEMDGYYGHVEDIDLSLYRGAYEINDIYINKVDTVSKKQTEFFKSSSIDLSVEWRALFHKRIVGKIIFNSPVLIFTKNKVEFSQVKKDTTTFLTLLNNFMPLDLNRFEINNGEIHYTDKTTSPVVDIALKRSHIVALNLSNVVNKDVLLPSTITGEASAYGGSLNFDMKMDAFAPVATFDLNLKMENTNLALLNDFLRAYGKFDVDRGKLGLYMEMAAEKGRFVGYVKPIIKDLKVLGPKDSSDTFFHKVWENVIGVAGMVLKNRRKDQVATKVPIEGNFSDPKINIGDAIVEIIRNAFIEALIPSLDNSININSVTDKPEEKTTIFRKIFSDKEERKRKREKRKSE